MTRLTKRATTLLAWTAITAGAGIVGGFVQQSSIGVWVEQRSYDLRFAYRGALPPSSEVPITILAIDEVALNELPEPLMLWHSHFGLVLQNLAAAGATTVGIDFLFADITDFDSDGQQQLSAALIGAGALDMPIVLAYRVGRLGVQEPPEAVLFAALAVGHRLGYANLTTDSDDFVRRQEIAAPGDEGFEPSFPLAVAQAYADKTGRAFSFDPESAPRPLINFGGPEQFPRVSFGDAVDAARRNDMDFFASRFADRIVLIGRIGERGDEDFHSTPQYYWTDRSNPEVPWRTPGVEIHAHTITTLIEDIAIEEESGRHQMATTLGVAAAVTGACLLLAPAWGIAASLIIMGALVAFAFIVLFPSGYWLHLVSPLSAGAIALGAAQVTNYVREGREKRYLRSAFKRYVNDDVIQQILASPDALSLRGESRRISVLFADIRNFTSRSEGISAETLVFQLNRYFEGMVEAIQSNGGMLDKYIGDGIMALFGAPLEDEQSALHAVRAAQAMLAALDDVNAALTERGYEPIGIGVGIHTGTAIIGNIGSPDRMEYTAIGDVVNTASRIESLTRKFDADILISKDTFEAVKGEIAAEHLGSTPVKGKAEPVDVYRVVQGTRL